MLVVCPRLLETRNPLLAAHDSELGDIWVTEEFGKVPVQTITFSRDSVYVGDSCGHGLTLPLGAVID